MSHDSETNEPECSKTDEFLTLFAHSQRRLHLYILAMVFNPTDAADILQETNLVLWQKFDQFQSGTNFFAWAREIARFRILRFRQVQARPLSLVSSELLERLAVELSDTDENETARQSALEHCLEVLSSNDRELVLSRYKNGATVRGLASRLQRSENGISQSLGLVD